MEKFTKRKEAALEALLDNPNLTAAARESGICRATLYNYLEDPAFKAELAKRKRDQLEEGNAQLRAGIKEAVKELRKIITKKGTSDQTRVNAINALLTHAAKFAEIVDVMERLDQLESTQAEKERRETKQNITPITGETNEEGGDIYAIE